MWSAIASESSGVIGPTSRRTRPRLSSRCVRSVGSSGRSVRQAKDVHAAILRRHGAAARRATVDPLVLGPARAAAAWSARACASPPAAARAPPASASSARDAARRRSASRSRVARRSSASSRLRAWLRSSCETARNTGPARSTTRRFCASLSVSDASTSKRASTRVSALFACCPPGPLDRETLIEISASGIATDAVTRRRIRGSHASEHMPAPVRRQAPARWRASSSTSTGCSMSRASRSPAPSRPSRSSGRTVTHFASSRTTRPCRAMCWPRICAPSASSSTRPRSRRHREPPRASSAAGACWRS